MNLQGTSVALNSVLEFLSLHALVALEALIFRLLLLLNLFQLLAESALRSCRAVVASVLFAAITAEANGLTVLLRCTLQLTVHLIHVLQEGVDVLVDCALCLIADRLH